MLEFFRFAWKVTYLCELIKYTHICMYVLYLMVMCVHCSIYVWLSIKQWTINNIKLLLGDNCDVSNQSYHRRYVCFPDKSWKLLLLNILTVITWAFTCPLYCSYSSLTVTHLSLYLPQYCSYSSLTVTHLSLHLPLILRLFLTNSDSPEPSPAVILLLFLTNSDSPEPSHALNIALIPD